MTPRFHPKSKLPRLSREAYQGRAFVFWTHTLVDRGTGWLGPTFHLTFREVLLHASARYTLVCPAYVLMPDHCHLVWLGTRESSDQRLATALLRQHLAPHLRPWVLQDRPHDHVLRDVERARGAFEITVHYVRENPVRAGLASAAAAWPYVGAMVPGYPDLNPAAGDYWDRFWRIYARLVERS